MMININRIILLIRMDILLLYDIDNHAMYINDLNNVKLM